MRKRTLIVLALGSAGATAQEPQDPPAPDLDFLEYLGSWQAGDEEWLAVAEWDKDAPPPPRAERGAEDRDAPQQDEQDRTRNDDDAP